MNGRICAAATAKTMPELRAMVKNAERARADLVEVRLDYLNEDCDLREIRDLTALPIIATNRLIEEGGLFEGTEEKRVSVLVDPDLLHVRQNLLCPRICSKVCVPNTDSLRQVDLLVHL